MLWRSVLVVFAIASVYAHEDDDSKDDKNLPQCNKKASDEAMKMFNTTTTANKCGQFTLANLTSLSKMSISMITTAQRTSLCSTDCVSVMNSVYKNQNLDDCTVMIGNMAIELREKIEYVLQFCTMQTGMTTLPSSPSSTPSPSTNPSPAATSGGSIVVQSSLVLSLVGFVMALW